MTTVSAENVPLAPLVEQVPRVNVARAAFFFGLVYFSQGICQVPALINQPLRQYLMHARGFTTTQVADFIFIVGLPWVIKPAYGLLSDFFPIFGYRRKSYLLLLNLMASAAFFCVSTIESVDMLLIMLTLTGVGVAASDVVVDAMMVQAGQQTGRNRLFQGAQWFSYYTAAIVSGLVGSAIIRAHGTPAGALRTAALIAMCVPFFVATLSWLFVKEPRAVRNVAEFKATSKALLFAFTDGRLWLIVVFLALLHFHPGVVTPLYVHLEKNVGLPHAFQAILDMSRSAGAAVGALVFMILMSGRMSMRMTAVIGIILGVLGWLGLLLIEGKSSAVAAYSFRGFSYMIMSLAQLALAAEVCPRRVEAVVFAALMSVNNLSMQYSDKIGAKLYDGVFQHRIEPLIWMSAAFTAVAIFLVPLLPRTREQR
jgi:MFS family permease